MYDVIDDNRYKIHIYQNDGNKIPTVENADEFAEWISTDGNFDKFIASIDKWK